MIRSTQDANSSEQSVNYPSKRFTPIFFFKVFVLPNMINIYLRQNVRWNLITNAKYKDMYTGECQQLSSDFGGCICINIEKYLKPITHVYTCLLLYSHTVEFLPLSFIILINFNGW